VEEDDIEKDTLGDPDGVFPPLPELKTLKEAATENETTLLDDRHSVGEGE